MVVTTFWRWSCIRRVTIGWWFGSQAGDEDGVERVSESQGVRVLLVDDQPEVRTLMRMMFGSAGRFAIAGEAANGEEAITRSAELQPDVVVLDVDMPVRDGLASIIDIRRGAPDTTIVMFSSGGDAVSQKALANGAHSFINKSAGVPALIDEVVRLTG